MWPPRHDQLLLLSWLHGVSPALLQLRTMCEANEPGKMLTDIMGTDWLTSITTEKVRQMRAQCGHRLLLTAPSGLDPAD